MPKIISIQGTNGSGKTTIVYKLLDKFPNQPIYGMSGPRYPEAYRIDIGLDEPLHVLGPYHTPTGGTDWIGDFDKLLYLINKYRMKGHVLFEGLITSGVRGRVGEELEKYGKTAAVLFLDTPLETCIERVQKRRETKGNKKEFNPANLTKKFKSVQLVKKKYIDSDILTVISVSSDDGHQRVLDFIVDAFDCPMCKAPGATADGCGICGSGPDG